VGPDDPDGEPAEDGSRAPRPGPRERLRLRAAFALEEAGELQEAARLLEHIGEHAQAATLRLEHAHTLRDEEERLAVLREGAARNRGDTEQGAALHRALAEALLTAAAGGPEGGRTRALSAEAARALDEAGDGAAAGELYEQLGMLDRAARAYERAGEISRLDLVLEVLDRRQQDQDADRERERELDQAAREGQRSLLRSLALDHVRASERRGRAPREAALRWLAELERRRPRAGRLSLRYGVGTAPPSAVTIHTRPTLRIGRAPDMEVVAHGPALSRHHAELSLDRDAAGGTTLVAVDQGAPAGTFWDGEPLEPGERRPLRTRGELSLGLSSPFSVVPLPGAHGAMGAVVVGSAGSVDVFLPVGGPLVLAPDRVAPASLGMEGPFPRLVLARAARAWLDDHALGAGAHIELVVGDRVRAAREGEPELWLEVLA
jgi:tetratricopeptide (TPR) repeat protein